MMARESEPEKDSMSLEYVCLMDEKRVGLSLVDLGSLMR